MSAVAAFSLRAHLYLIFQSRRRLDGGGYVQLVELWVREWEAIDIPECMYIAFQYSRSTQRFMFASAVSMLCKHYMQTLFTKYQPYHMQTTTDPARRQACCIAEILPEPSPSKCG